MKKKTVNKCAECGREAGTIKNYPGRSIAITVKKLGAGYPPLCQYCRAKWTRGY